MSLMSTMRRRMTDHGHQLLVCQAYDNQQSLVLLRM
jgi:hypothetical protein